MFRKNFQTNSFRLWIVIFGLLVTITLNASGKFCYARGTSTPEIKLVLQITIDGLRADLLERYKTSFSDGGFNYLLKNGVYYTNSHYGHANTETIVGHATLATGAPPRIHGMIGNVWFDRRNLELSYNIEDPDHSLLQTDDSEAEGTQVDPAQLKSRTDGRSPVALLAPTLSDTMSAFYAGKSKIFGVSGKDRSAVAMAGKTGKAFWFSTNSGDFVTSSYYYKTYPDWVKKWNDSDKPDAFSGKSWELNEDTSSYVLLDQDDRPYEANLKGYGRTFPHPYGITNDPLFYTRIIVSPEGDRLTLDFAKQLVKEEELGQDSAPDYLSISFSGVDAVNHFFGPSSLENEDIIIQLDKTLAQLFTFIEKEIGLDKTLIALSADHGMADMPEYMSELGYQVGRLDTKEIVQVANDAGENLGIEDVVQFFYRPYLYLNEKEVLAAGKNLAEIRMAISKTLTDIEGVARAVPKDALKAGKLDDFTKRVFNNQHQSRSGDIYIAQEPYWFLFEPGYIVAMHGSPWKYDTHVPLIISGPGIQATQVSRLVHPVDLAPTLAAYLGLSGPAASAGVALPEVVQTQKE